MPRLNVLHALDALSLPESLHENVYRLLLTLENSESNHYNPYAADVIRRLLINISDNGSLHERNYLTVSFMGQYESLLISLSGGINRNAALELFELAYSSIIGGTTPDLSLFKKITKVDFEEKISSLLYGSSARDIYAIENHYPKISLSEEGAGIMISAAVKRYLNSTPEPERRANKLRYLNAKAADTRLNKQDRLLCDLLARELAQYGEESQSEGGDMFNRIFRESIKGLNVSEDLIKNCIKTRNKAVHEGKCRTSTTELAIMLLVLFCSRPAIKPTDELDSNQSRIEADIRTEVAKDLRAKRNSKIRTVIFSAVSISALLYAIAVFVTGLFVGESEIRKVTWDTHSTQFNARINEVIATKDTTQLLEIQRDQKWINENLYKKQ